MKYILGINLPLKSKCHESGVALIDLDGNILFAANEERFSRNKLDGDFPERSIKKMFEYTGIAKEDIIYVAVPTLSRARKALRFAEFIFRERLSHLFRLKTYAVLSKILIREKSDKPYSDESGGFKIRYFWKDFIKTNFPNAQIKYVEHHVAHAAGAYFCSPWERALFATSDGAGNILTSLVGLAENGRLKAVAKTFLPHSMGSFWGSITKVCGFKSGTRHGGKVTGLAASGNPAKLIDKMRQAVWAEGLKIKTVPELFFDNSKLLPNWDSYEPERIKKLIGEATREEVAAAAQQRLEEVVVEIVKNLRKKIDCDKIVLAGGVFANVLLNQKILALDGISDIFVFPAMSDGGIALGSAFLTLSKMKERAGSRLLPKRIANVYLGPHYTNQEIETALEKQGLKYSKMETPAKTVAGLVHGNKVVALYQGRMEYGPRALGNRSIIYAPIDPTVNDWLNKKLNRSEFMPFAPVTMIEHVKNCYLGIAADPVAARFMTVTYHCTEAMKTKAPACVHLDGTARPQVIDRATNPYYYDIINEYYKLSGIPTLINTSFNMHEEPIVASPEDAIRAFLDSGIDYLVLENYLCGFAENQK